MQPRTQRSAPVSAMPDSRGARAFPNRAPRAPSRSQIRGSAGAAVGIFAIAVRQRQPNAFGSGAKLVGGDTHRRQDTFHAASKSPSRKLAPKPKRWPVRLRSTYRIVLRRSAAPLPDAAGCVPAPPAISRSRCASLTFPRRIDGEHDVRLLRRRIEKEIAMHIELELLERAQPVRLRNQEGWHRTRPARAPGLSWRVEDGAASVGTSDPAARRRTDRTPRGIPAPWPVVGAGFSRLSC